MVDNVALGSTSIAVVAVLAFALKAWQDFDSFSLSRALVWPPSWQSAPALTGIALFFAVAAWHTLFKPSQAAETERVRQDKKRLFLAQMAEGLRWDQDPVKSDKSDDESDQKNDAGSKKEGDSAEKKEEEKKVKRPPSAKDLYDMLFDSVEERHVVEYGVDATSEPYLGVRQLFEERVPADLEEAVKFTVMSRSSLQEVHELSREELKRIAEFCDGTKLSDLLKLYKNITKHFGKGMAPKSIVEKAEACYKQLGDEQRKGLQILYPMVRPLLPMYATSVALMVFDSIVGACLWHSLSTVLDGVAAGTLTMEGLKWITARNMVTFGFSIFSRSDACPRLP
mmetsp:Transcript_52402/g.170076  ORF Transcript_52402/g.170076 Transcript_52402/m.170076 type:complete len:339 (-) Transcript_52402:232-1248(-)